MTLQDIRSQLIIHLSDKDTFGINEIDSVHVAKELTEHKEVAIRTVLAGMVEDGIVKPLGDNMWILAISSSNMVQTIQLSMETCLTIAELQETFFEANDMEYDEVNPLKITERDIVVLINIMNDLLDGGPPGGPTP